MLARVVLKKESCGFWGVVGVYADKYLKTKKREKERMEKATIFMNIGVVVAWGDDELVYMAFIFGFFLMQENGRMEKQDLILKKRVFQNSDSLPSFHVTEPKQ